MVMNYKWNYNTINQIHIELSTYCNAGCPMCPRHVSLPDFTSLPVVRPDLVLESVSFENFKKWFPPEFAKNVVHWLFCGTHGDPMMNKDILEIMNYVCQFGPAVSVNTNGGMRTPDFWRELARIMAINQRPNRNRHVTFSIDGLEDTNHLYRRNVPFKKAIENAQAFISEGGHALWDFLIFKHNEHQIEEASFLAKKLGFKFFVPKKALGFQPSANEDGGLLNRVVRTPQGEIDYIIEPPTLKNTNFNKKTKLVTITPKCEKNFDTKEYVRYLKETSTNYQSKKEKYLEAIPSYIPREEERCTSIVCKSHLSSVPGEYMHEVYVDAYGNVFPCCYVGTHYNSKFNGMSNLQLGIEIEEFGLDKISLKNYSLKEILESGYLQNVFEDKWGKTFEQGGMLYCNETCGEKSAVDKIFTHELDERPEIHKSHLTIQKERANIHE